jgi:glyoxylase-like metal-dependent hydrolase (beta-lactamase superfamily II)
MPRKCEGPVSEPDARHAAELVIGAQAKGATPAPRRRRRWILWLVLAVVAVLLVPVVAIGSAFYGTTAIEDGRPFGGVRTVKLGYVAAFVLDAGNGTVALVDTGADAKGELLLAALRARGIAPEAVRAIFLTHGHSDHVAAAPLFPRAEIYALYTEIPLIEGRTAGHSPISKLISAKPSGVRVTHPLSDGERVTVGELRVQAFAIPGHTEGSAAYLAEGVLFLGDAATATKSGHVAGPAWVFSDDRRLGRESLQRLSARLSRDYSPVRVLAFAHSGAIEAGDAIVRLYEVE